MPEFAVTMTTILLLVAMGVIGFVLGESKAECECMRELNRVGIEKIVQCNNVQSNWCEIVWIKNNKETK